MIEGTHQEVEFVRVADGDTVVVRFPGQDDEESLRLLCLDTEESYAISGKPVTPWGMEAKAFAEAYFADATQVTVEFPGNDPLDVCLQRYRDNYGRLLVFLHHRGEDYQERMIAEGYSPYFCKYGYANFADKHQRYCQAEMLAQQNDRGVWNQLEVNGGVARNYPLLSMWWHTRAGIIEGFRHVHGSHPHIMNSRLDYDALNQRAVLGQSACVFVELAYVVRAGGIHGLISHGSEAQPFHVFIPRLFSDEMKPMLNLLNHRYLGSDDRPALSYAYIQGEMSIYQGKPQLWLRQVSQISDVPPPAVRYPVYISALLPDPLHVDAGAETLTLHNPGTTAVNLTGWWVEDKQGRRFNLEGEVAAGAIRHYTLPPYSLRLNNTGDELSLFDDQSRLQQRISYEKQQVRPGESLHFTAPA